MPAYLDFFSDDLPPVDRVPCYRDAVGRMLTRMDIEPAGEGFACNAHGYRLRDLSILRVTGSAVRVNRTREMTAGSDQVVLLMYFGGAATVAQRGREVQIRRGCSILFSSAEPLRIDRTAARFVALGVPASVLAPVDLEKVLMSVMPNATEPLRLLARYVRLLIEHPALIETAALRRLAVHHVHDLIALAIGATRDAADVAVGRGLRAARMRAIKADIAENLHGDVSVDALSARHNISPRYIRKLFEGENTSLSQFVLGERLTRVRRMLTDPRQDGRTIADIALAAGFNDLSTFNREFRRRFGTTPSHVRRRQR